MGQRVTVYLRKADREASAAFRFERQGNLSLFYWVDGPCGYALVGPLSRERLLTLAQAIARQDPPAPAAPTR
jgi:anti-sigma factor RsiW